MKCGAKLTASQASGQAPSAPAAPRAPILAPMGVTSLKCPNCGSDQFAETSDNAALGFRCDCGLEFNLMPQLRRVQITRDPTI